MNDMTMFFAALAAAGAAYFAVQWLQATRELAKRSDLERRRAAIEHANRERVQVRTRIRAFAAKNGWSGDLTVVGIALIFLYCLVIAALSLISVSGWLAPILGLPVSAFVVAWGVSSTAHRRRTAFNSQLIQALDLLVTQLQAGTSAALALERIVPNLPDPLRTEFDQALVRKRANMELSTAVSEVADRYPSRAMAMLVAALRIDEQRGAKMAPALEQAAHTVRREFELRSESDAEVAQERMQFFAIVGIVGGIVLYSFTSSSDFQREALVSPTGLAIVGLGAANFVFGIFRVLRMLQKAKGE